MKATRSLCLRSALRATLVLLGVFSAQNVVASPGARAGFGSRSQAFAGAEVADAQGPPAVFENPGALVQTPDTELSLGTSYTSYDFALDDADVGLSSVPTLDFGAVIPGSVATIPIAFGLALSLPDFRYSNLHNADPTVAYLPLDDSGPRLFDLGMALAVRPVAWLAVGGGVGFLAAARGGFRVQGTAVAADGSGSEYESDLDHSVEADLVSVRYPIFGVTVTASRELTLGLAFRGSATIQQRVAGELAGTARIGMTEFPVSYQFETRASLAFLPAVIAIGGTFRPLASWRVGAQVDWEGYSAYPSPFARPETELVIDPPPGVPIMPVEPAPLPEPVALSDRFVPRVGVEKSFELERRLELALRVGYAYQAAVVPAEQSETLLVDLDRHVLALGAGSAWKRPAQPFSELRLDVHVSLTQGVARDISTGPSDARATYRVSGSMFGAGATLGLAFDALGRTPPANLY
jgi:long-chain fatty acid transport protein